MKRAAIFALALIPTAGLMASARAQSAGQWLGPEPIWESACGYCHGAGVAPELRGRRLPATLIRKIVREGYAGMPPFHPSELSDQEVAALADWIAKSEAPPPPQPQPQPKAPK